MASSIIGRARCPECGFENAHVKQSEKCLFRYCPECHSQTFAKSDRQQQLMRNAMRPPVEAVAAPAPPAAPSAPVAAPPPDPKAAAAPPTAATGSGAPKAPKATTPAPPTLAPVAHKRSSLFGW